MELVEIFDSISGEADGFLPPGQVSTFVRLAGCNLKCSWCDTNHKSIRTRSVDALLLDRHFWCKHVVITGGEPLLQRAELAPLVEQLLSDKRQVTIETNGTQELLATADGLLRPNLRYVVDYKLLSSGMTNYMNLDVFKSLNVTDVIKFVIADKVDFDYFVSVIDKLQSRAQKVISPVWSVGSFTWPQHLAKLLIDSEINAGYSLQIHKILNVK